MKTLKISQVLLLALFSIIFSISLLNIANAKSADSAALSKNVLNQNAKKNIDNPFVSNKLQSKGFRSSDTQEKFRHDFIRDEYKESVTWIRSLWSLRITLISILITALGVVISSKFSHSLLIFLSSLGFFLIVSIDIVCTYVTLPFIYTSIYIEKYYAPSIHPMISNWNEWQNKNISKLVKADDSVTTHNNFRDAYIVYIYEKKSMIFVPILTLFLLWWLVYAILKKEKLAEILRIEKFIQVIRKAIASKFLKTVLQSIWSKKKNETYTQKKIIKQTKTQ